MQFSCPKTITHKNQSRVICCMYSVLFCFSYLYLKLLFFEKGGLIFQHFLILYF